MGKYYEYNFSVIMAIYNSEKYLNEAIDSVINQTIGFEDNIQLILVNDGSSDNSERICIEYQKQYPENIVYHKKENGGASSARNAGRQYVTGKYLNFFDSDDIWDSEAFERAYYFFEKNYNEIDIVVGRTINFGDITSPHPLDFKFEKGDRIVDLDDEFYCIQLGNAPCFFKVEAIEGLYYNTNLFVSEDNFFIAQATLNCFKHGLVSELKYYYRRFKREVSLSTRCRKKKEWYFDTLEKCHNELIHQSVNRLGYVPKYIQYMLLYELQWRIPQNNITNAVLSEDERIEYRKYISNILQYIDDDVIYQLKKRNLSFKGYLYKLKYGRNILKDAEIIENHFLYYNGVKVYNFFPRGRLTIDILEIRNENMVLEGVSDLNDLERGFRIYAIDNNNNTYEAQIADREYKNVYSFCGELIHRAITYSITIPLKGVSRIKFFIKLDNQHDIRLKPGLGQFSGMTHAMKNTYCCIGKKYILKYINNEIRIYPYAKKTYVASELRFRKELKSLGREDIIKVRRTYYIKKAFRRKPIWIVRDRFERAGDNGESVFKYLMNWKDKDKYHIVFLLEKDSIDYKRLSQYGEVMDPNGKDYIYAFLLASKIIDSIVTKSSINPFGKDQKYYRNLLSFDYIGLFHGIGQRDMSSWTNKFNFNLKLYVSGAQKEYEAMLKENNGYDKSIIKLTGLPRFDELTNNESRIIAIMPTWRQDIAGPIISGTTQREYVYGFQNTEYFQFYNSLINNKQLLDKMKELNYTAVFYNHPNFRQQYNDYVQNDIIRVSKENANAQEVISNCAMLVTDYSSAQFECAYLEKPVVYTQFDHDTFIERHTGNEGYFNYHTDSFGPICYNVEESVNAIIHYMENDCKMELMYKERVNNFFIYKDRGNCKRLVDEIMKLDSVK